MMPKPSAWGTVRTAPSRIAPFAVFGEVITSCRIPRITESGTRSPRSMNAFASFPRGVPSRRAARSTSPVAIFGIPSRSASLSACVPLPAPGGPSRTMITVRPGRKKFGGAFGSSEGNRPLLAIATRRTRRSVAAAATLAAAEANATLLHEAIVLAKQEVLIHLRHRIQRDTNDDEQRRPAEPEGHVDHVGDENRKQRNKREEERAREGDSRDYVIDVLSRLLTGLHTRDESRLLLQILRDVDGI